MQILYPGKKTMPLRVFQGMLAISLVKSNKRRRGRLSDEARLSPMMNQKKKIQGKPTNDVRKDGLDHFPSWEEKRQRRMNCRGVSSVSHNRHLTDF